MSQEQLQAFIDALKSESELVQKVQGASSHEAIAKIAKDAGFEISADHVIEKTSHQR